MHWSKYVVLLAFIAGLLAPVAPVNAASNQEYDPSVCSNDTSGKPLSSACAGMIAAFPRPNVKEIGQDGYTLSAYSFWKVGPEATDTYDKPNGSVVAQIPKGFNFVNAIDQSVDGWLQIQGGKWIKRSDAKETQPSFFRGVSLTDDLKYDFAWVLDKSGIYLSEYPGGPASSKTKRTLVRYELVNIFATAKDSDGKDWYMIGPNQWVKQTFIAKAHKIAIPQGVTGHWVAVDLYEQTMVAYEDDKPIFATLVASGVPHHETNEGLFKIWARLDQDSMSGATGAPSAYALQMVPWVMYFDGSISLHGTYWHDLFGYRQSHGCVNLSISDAKFIFEWTGKAPLDESGKPLTYVYVYSSGKYGSGVIRQ
jgi:hypothetical protein